MSAVRRNTNRSTTRAALSSPYARRTKNSTWSLTGLLSFLNPLRFRDSSEDDGLSSSDESEEEVVEERGNPVVSASTAAQTLFRKGQQLTEKIRANGHSLHEQPSNTNTSSIPSSSSAKRKSPEPPVTLPSTTFTFTAKPSLTKNIDTVSEYLTRHVNKPISEAEVKTLVSLLQQSKPETEHFRFESRPPTSPPRSRSPSVPAPTASTTHLPRTLTRNPNGTYTWKGAGSSRTSRSRNRFSSPAFRLSPVGRPERRTSPERPVNDVKRRRTGEAPVTLQISTTTADDTGAQNQMPFPATEPTTTRPSTTGSTLKAPPTGTSPVRYRTPGLQKPTTPVHPSPLRQAWSDGSPSASESIPSRKPSPVKQTETAKHVSELVNNLKTRDKIPDIANPYETASPVKPKPAPKRKRVTAVTRKATVAKKEEELPESKIKDLPAHAVIEATLPEGSKRSRPPPNLERPVPLDSDKRKEKSPPADEAEAPPSKRAKPSLNGRPISPPTQLQEPKAIEPQASASIPKEPKENSVPAKAPAINIVPPTSSAATNKSLFGGPRSSTIPKEPSKLRFSMQAESTSTPPSPPSVLIPVKEETTSASSFTKIALPSAEAKDGAPQFTFNSTTVKQIAAFGSATTPPTEDSVPVPVSASTPTEKIVVSSSSSIFSPTEKKDDSIRFTSALKSLTTEKDAVPAAASSTASIVLSEKKEMSSVFAFAPPYTEKKASVSISDVPSTMMKTDIAPTSVSTITTERNARDAAKDMPVSALPVFSFTFTATTSDFTKHSSTRDKAKTLPQSSLPAFDLHAPPRSNTAPSNSAPSSASTSLTPFNWGAAGVQRPSASNGAGDEWTCGTCMLKNPASATEKCTICDEPKPGAATSTYAVPKPSLNSSSSSGPGAGSIPKSNGAVGFNWGLKNSTATNDGEWTCNTCMLKNPGSATEKCTVCDAPKPGAAPSAPKATFNWAAAGIQSAPSTADGEWTCGTCMLKNPASATEKCTVCDAKRS